MDRDGKRRACVRNDCSSEPVDSWVVDWMESAFRNGLQFQADRSDIFALRSDQPVVRKLFEELSGPSGSAGDGEDRREKIGGDSERVVNGG